MLMALQKDMSDLNTKYLEQQKQLEDAMHSKDAAAQCELIACFRHLLVTVN